MHARILRLKDAENPDSLKLDSEEIAEPGPGEVRIRFTSIGLNRADLLYPRQRYFTKAASDTRLGFEGAGVVESCGAGTTMLEGSRVAICPMQIDVSSQGTLAEAGIYREDQLIMTPSHISDSEAGGIWMAYLTAWGALLDIGALQAGQTVVITAASSSVGLAAIDIARSLGARSIATTTTQTKARQLEELGANTVLMQPRDEDAYAGFAEQVQAFTDGQGCDLTFDAVAGPASQALIRGSRRGGQIIIHGLLDRRPMNVHAGVLMKRLLTLRGYTLDETLSKPEVKKRAIEWLTSRFDSGELHPVIARTFPFNDYRAAFDYLESNQQIGKIVVVP